MAFRLMSAALVAVFTIVTGGDAVALDARLTPQQQQMQNAHDSFVACMKMNAIRLEPSGETASDIAIAALRECRDHEADEIASSIIVEGKPFTVEQMDRIDNDMRAEAITAIVETRAARHKH